MFRSLLLALLITAAGAAITYFTIYEPWLAMSRGEGDVSFSLKGQFFGPFIAVTGVCFLIAALAGIRDFSRPWAQQSTQARIALVISLLLGLAASAYICLVWFPAEADKFGYVSG